MYRPPMPDNGVSHVCCYNIDKRPIYHLFFVCLIPNKIYSILLLKRSQLNQPYRKHHIVFYLDLYHALSTFKFERQYHIQDGGQQLFIHPGT